MSTDGQKRLAGVIDDIARRVERAERSTDGSEEDKEEEHQLSKRARAVGPDGSEDDHRQHKRARAAVEPRERWDPLTDEPTTLVQHCRKAQKALQVIQEDVRRAVTAKASGCSSIEGYEPLSARRDACVEELRPVREKAQADMRKTLDSLAEVFALYLDPNELVDEVFCPLLDAQFEATMRRMYRMPPSQRQRLMAIVAEHAPADDIVE